MGDDPVVEFRGMDVASGGGNGFGPIPSAGGGSGLIPTTTVLQPSDRQTTIDSIAIEAARQEPSTSTGQRTAVEQRNLYRGDTKNTIRQFLNNRRDLTRNNTYPKKPRAGYQRAATIRSDRADKVIWVFILHDPTE